MAKFTLYPMANCVLLANNETNKTEEIFPMNEARFQNRAWDWYLRTHEGLDWELSYDLIDTELDDDNIPANYEEYIRPRDEKAYLRYVEYKSTHPSFV